PLKCPRKTALLQVSYIGAPTPHSSRALIQARRAPVRIIGNRSRVMEDRGIKKHPLARRAVKTGQGIKVTRACTIRKPAGELFQFWRNLENLPRFMRHVVAVQKISDVESRWTVKAPGGRSVQWNAVIFNEEPNRLIAWRTREGADVPNAGSVRFEPTNDGDGATTVKVALEYDPPGGKFTAFLSKLFGKEPDIQVAQDLAR